MMPLILFKMVKECLLGRVIPKLVSKPWMHATTNMHIYESVYIATMNELNMRRAIVMNLEGISCVIGQSWQSSCTYLDFSSYCQVSVSHFDTWQLHSNPVAFNHKNNIK